MLGGFWEVPGLIRIIVIILIVACVPVSRNNAVFAQAVSNEPTGPRQQQAIHAYFEGDFVSAAQQFGMTIDAYEGSGSNVPSDDYAAALTWILGMAIVDKDYDKVDQLVLNGAFRKFTNPYAQNRLALPAGVQHMLFAAGYLGNGDAASAEYMANTCLYEISRQDEEYQYSALGWNTGLWCILVMSDAQFVMADFEGSAKGLATASQLVTTQDGQYPRLGLFVATRSAATENALGNEDQAKSDFKYALSLVDTLQERYPSDGALDASRARITSALAALGGQ